MAPRLARWARFYRRCDIVYLRRPSLSLVYPRDQYRYLASLFQEEAEMEIYPCIRMGGEDCGIELERKGVEKIEYESPPEGIFLYFSRFSI